jgi:uncharacterized protein (DUF302 family)
MRENDLIIERTGRFKFGETVDLLVAEAERREWQVPAVHDLQKSLAKSGKSVKPVKVIEICKPAYSGTMLELNDERVISVMMPCRISVYEKEDGKTYVALINVGHLSSGLPEKIAGVMKRASEETIEIVGTVV